MSDQPSAEREIVESAARRYRRAGYSVTEPATRDQVPPFLEGYVPDLIAETENDRVIIEIKNVRSLPGDNQLKAVAAMIEGQPGWRFELITAPSPEEQASEETLDLLSDKIRQTAKGGQREAALIFSWSLVEQLLRDISTRAKLNSKEWSAQKTAYTLVTRGVLDHQDYDRIRNLLRWRNAILHGDLHERASEHEIERAIELCSILKLRSDTFGKSDGYGQAA